MEMDLLSRLGGHFHHAVCCLLPCPEWRARVRPPKMGLRSLGTPGFNNFPCSILCCLYVATSMFDMETFLLSSATFELENGLGDFSPKPAAMRPSQNTQSPRGQPELRNPAKPLSRPVSSNQPSVPSSLSMLDEVPVSSGSKKLGRSCGMAAWFFWSSPVFADQMVECLPK